MNAEKGCLAIVLHAHLPFVRHPEHDEFLEEDWLFEGITETYLPLLARQEELVREGVRYRLTMSLTPPLCEMLADPLLQGRYLRYLDKRIDLMKHEVEAKKNSPFEDAARMYRDILGRSRELFHDRWGDNILNGFRELQGTGSLEIMTCAATHGFLPLMLTPEAVRAQIEIGCRNYEKHFGRRPRGFWLPECAYAPGLDEQLARSGIRFFIVDSHGILLADPEPVYGVHAPIVCPSGVAAFGRDYESSKQVWSSEEGYPGEALYREFYRDLGYDADYAYIKPYLHADGVRRNLGIKYHRVTGKVELHEKQPYVPSWAREKASQHADDFVANRRRQAEWLAGALGRTPVVLSPYDAELYGHWWFEGPDFLADTFRKLHYNQREVTPVTPAEYIERFRVNQAATPAGSSWGDKGYYEVWLNGANDWIYRHLHAAEERMVALATKHRDERNDVKLRAMKQMARELVLAQSSDWAFIMTVGGARPYATRRTNLHLDRFRVIADQIESGAPDEGYLSGIEGLDTIFQEIDFRLYAREA